MKKWIKDKFRETLNQTFTLLGMFIAWVVLDGSAKTVVGWAILYSMVVWLFSMKFREQEEEVIKNED
jgi:Ca2+/Na+ antiporter